MVENVAAIKIEGANEVFAVVDDQPEVVESFVSSAE